jgi:hypothetical protein
VSARHSKMSQPTTDLAVRIQSILALKDLTLYRVSRRSETLYGRSSPYFLPHNLYFDLRSSKFSPSIYQFFALSHITGYRLPDWLRLFGADLENIARLQASLPSRRTILLDSSLADPYTWVPWFRDRIGNSAVPPIAPLGQLLERSAPKRLSSLSENHRGFLYAKIGYQDALAFPDLFPGSVVRVNPDISDKLAFLPNGVSSRIFLMEHSKGFVCCRLRAIGDRVIVPVSTKVCHAQIELRLPQDVSLLGVVDLEVRPLQMTKEPEVPKDLARRWKPRPLSREGKVGPLLRGARVTMRLSLREASEISRKIADLLGDDRYFISPSSLCDYELLNAAPRHFQKAITLCSLYGLRFQTFLTSVGIEPDEAGREPIPDHFVSRVQRIEAPEELDTKVAAGGFLEQFLERSDEIPFFLRDSIGSLSGLEDVSLSDFFWVGGRYDVLHPYLTNGLLALVNRRKKRPLYFASKPLWQQPLYVLLKRDGTYLCACCGLENGFLVVHPYSQQFHRPEQFRPHHDVEVVGQVVMIARRVA